MSTELVSFLTFLLGLALGHWLAIGRDKRKEFNDAATSIRSWLLGAKDSPDPYSPWPSEQEFDRFINYLGPWQQSTFRKHLDIYKTLHNELQVQDSCGQVSYSEDRKISSELNKLFKYTKPR